MGELLVLASGIADGGLIKTGKINSNALSNIVVVPVAVPTALDADVPMTRTILDRRQSLDRFGEFAGIHWLQDAPRTLVLGRSSPEA